MLQKNRRGKCLFRTLVLLCSIFVAPVSAQDIDDVSITADEETQKLLFRAEDLLGNGLHERAYELLIPQEARLAGNPLYDYLLGVAALDSGRVFDQVDVNGSAGK